MLNKKLKRLLIIASALMFSASTYASPIYKNYPWTQTNPVLLDYAYEHKTFIVKNGKRKLKLYKKYSQKIRDITNKHMVPAEVVVIAAIESSFVEDARSHAGAVGMWQFMAPTARDAGLIVNTSIDERLDWEKSTEAAVKYIKWLSEQFGGDYETAILAYNYGIGNVRRASRAVKSREAFKIIEGGSLPKESEEYLLKFLTYMHLFEYLNND